MEDKLILLVEDNPHIMAINDAALHMRGYRTLQAETAHKCRELLCFHAVDLIVLDILSAGRRWRGALPRDQAGIRCADPVPDRYGRK